MGEKLKNEPLVVRAAIVAVLTAILHLLAVLGVVPLPAEAEDAANGIIDAVAGAVLVWWVRRHVKPVRKGEVEPEAPAGEYEPEHAV